MSIAAKSKKDITTLKAQLSSEFEMKDLSAAKKILGMEITRDRKSGLLFLSQHDYLNKVLHRFNMPDANKVTTPIDHISNCHLLNVPLLMKILSTYLEIHTLVMLVL
jgi:hypothetical protein